MGKHRGYFAVALPSGSFQGWARDPAAGRYAKSTGMPGAPFRSLSEATAWAKQQHAKFLTRQESLNRQTTKRLVESYVNFLRGTKKRTDSHLANVERCLNALAVKMPEPGHPRATVQCEEWLASLPIAATTKVQYLNTCKALFNYAVERRLVDHNPLTVAETEEPDDTIKAQFTVEELRAMVRACDDPFHLHACLFVYLGLRIEEMVTTAWTGGLDYSEDFACITGKGNKTRLVPKPAELKAVLGWYRPAPQYRAERVFRFSTVTARRYLYAFLARLEITKGERTVHSTRHSYAGIMTATGISTSMLGDWMGHSSEGTTRDYATLATIYSRQVDGWPRGEPMLLRDAACSWPRPKASESTPTAPALPAPQ
jgi:site-specific recombinase XerD